MIRLASFAAAALLGAGLLYAGGHTAGGQDKQVVTLAADAPAKPSDKGNTPNKTTALANIQGAGANKDKIKGTVTFIEDKDSVKVLVDVTGLSPGKHGIHIHEKPDLSDPELKSAGGHWNPDGHKHGSPAEGMHHAGDLGNITADAEGHAKTELTLTGITVGGGKGSVVGHSVVIHEKEDDLKTDPAGNSGPRIAGGVIEAKS